MKNRHLGGAQDFQIFSHGAKRVEPKKKLFFFLEHAGELRIFVLRRKKGARALTTHTHTPKLLDKHTRLLLR
jgi:hypothetical protein